MHELTKLIKEDMKVALGVTEPGAIAFAVSKARSYTKGEIQEVEVKLNSGIYKNAFTCGIPNSDKFGNVFAAALGVVAGDPEKGLESLAKVSPEDNKIAEELVKDGIVKVTLHEISSDIFIEARVKTLKDSCTVSIEESHTNIVKIIVNDETIFEKKVSKQKEKKELPLIHKYTVQELLEYVNSVSFEEIAFVEKAYEVNMELFEEGLRSTRTSFIHQLLKMNKNEVFSENVLSTAQLLTNGAIEARVLGLDKPAMSITGSGAHGILATLPLLAEYKIKNLSKEMLCRATVFSYLICMYIKEYSGKLSAFCGCGIAAGTGVACALAYLRGASYEEISHVINNMASSITGMICDGGNHGCTMKGIVAIDAGFRSIDLAMQGVYISATHGINGVTPEQTMKQMGMIASPGMVGTEKTIVEIFEGK